MSWLFLSNTFLFIFCLLPFIVWSAMKNLTNKKNAQFLNLPPGPWKLPIIGNLHQLAGHLPYRKIADLAKKHGPIMHLKFGQVSTVVVSSPETAKQVLKTHDVVFAQRSFLLAADIALYKASDIVFASCKEQWIQLRRICIQALLGIKRVRFFRSIREEEVSNLIRNITSSSGFPINLGEMLRSLTCSVITRTAFGTQFKDQEALIPVAFQLIDLFSGLAVADLFPSIKLLHVITGIHKRVNKLHEKIDLVLESLINEVRISGADEGGDSLVHSLLNLQDSGKLEFPLTTDNIKGVILDMFLAGMDTSAVVIEWAMSEMIRNPKVMQKAQEEVRRILKGQKTIDESRIEQLNYLKLVIKETMRLHPVVTLLTPREGNEPCKINGYDIPAKTRVTVNVWALGRDPNYWMEPETFCPERFIDNAVDYKGGNFEYLPFGGGRRICPGISYGLAVVELVLAELLYYFDWELPNGKKKEELDMTEEFLATTKRKNSLCLIPIPYNHFLVE